MRGVDNSRAFAVYNHHHHHTILTHTHTHAVATPFQEACHNYVRILAKDKRGGVLVCGTNAYRPKCRQYVGDKVYERWPRLTISKLNRRYFQFGEYAQGIEFPGQGLCPYDPTHNSTYVRDGDMIYTGTGE